MEIKNRAVRHKMSVERNRFCLYFVPYGTKPHSHKVVFTNIKTLTGLEKMIDENLKTLS